MVELPIHLEIMVPTIARKYLSRTSFGDDMKATVGRSRFNLIRLEVFMAIFGMLYNIIQESSNADMRQDSAASLPKDVPFCNQEHVGSYMSFSLVIVILPSKTMMTCNLLGYALVSFSNRFLCSRTVSFGV